MPEILDTLKRFQKDFLSAVGRIGSVGEHAQDQVENRSMVVGDQEIERGFRTGLQFGDKFGFVTAP
jgi:hypothetical protein